MSLSEIRLYNSQTVRAKTKDGFREVTMGISQISGNATMEDILGALDTSQVVSDLLAERISRALGLTQIVAPDLSGIFKPEPAPVTHKPKKREFTVVSETPGPAVEIPPVETPEQFADRVIFEKVPGDPAVREKLLADRANLVADLAQNVFDGVDPFTTEAADAHETKKKETYEDRVNAATDAAMATVSRTVENPEAYAGDPDDLPPAIRERLSDCESEEIDREYPMPGTFEEKVANPQSQPSAAQRIEEKIAAMGLPGPSIVDQIAAIPDPSDVELQSPFTGVFGIGLRIPDEEDESWQIPLSEVNKDGSGNGQLMAINAALTGVGFMKEARHRAAEAILNGIDRERPDITITSTRELSKAQASIVLNWLENATAADLNRLGDAVRGVLI